MNLLPLIFIIFCVFYGIKCGKIRPNFDEIFGDIWDKNESEEKMIKMEQNQQNESSVVDQMGEENGNDSNDQQKREIIRKFEAIKEKLKQKGKFQRKNKVKIERKIGKLLGANRQKIYKWKNELNLKKNKIMKKSLYETKKNEFIERFDEFKELYGQHKQKEFVKELGIGETTFRKWKKELGPNFNKSYNKHSNDDKLKKMKQYFKFKEAKPKMRDEIIANKLGIGWTTLKEWKKKFA